MCTTTGSDLVWMYTDIYDVSLLDDIFWLGLSEPDATSLSHTCKVLELWHEGEM